MPAGELDPLRVRPLYHPSSVSCRECELYAGELVKFMAKSCKPPLDFNTQVGMAAGLLGGGGGGTCWDV